jgi:hypothetical protein
MSALATCTVSRASAQKNQALDRIIGLEPDEESYDGSILFFSENTAYVVRTDTKKIYSVNFDNNVSNVVALV